MIVRSRAPLRLGLGGGGTDLSPFCDLYGGYVLNATIDMYAYSTVEAATNEKVEFVDADREVVFETEASEYIAPEGDLVLHKGVYNRIVQEFNGGEPLPVTLTTYCDVPPGSGLGSSSTMVVAMVKAFVELLNLPLGEYEIAHLAYEVERVDLGLNGGKQDQYAATFGGINFMEFYANDRVIVNPLRVKNWIISELETSLVLFYTGVSRDSATIIEEQSSNVNAGREKPIAAMKEMKEEAVLMKECLLKGDIRSFAMFMDQAWESKKKMARNISNSQIDTIYNLAKQSGAYAGKVSGAGGGGFLMFLVEPLRRMDVMRVLEAQQGRAMTCHFIKYGTQGWRVA